MDTCWSAQLICKQQIRIKYAERVLLALFDHFFRQSHSNYCIPVPVCFVSMNSTRFGSFAICRTAHTHRMIDKCALTELYNHFFARAHSLSKRKQNALKLILGSCWILLFYCIRTDSNFADNRSLRLHRENETEKLLKLSLDSCAVQNTLYSSCHLTNIYVFFVVRRFMWCVEPRGSLQTGSAVFVSHGLQSSP